MIALLFVLLFVAIAGYGWAVVELTRCRRSRHCPLACNLRDSARYARTLLRNGSASGALRELDAALGD